MRETVIEREQGFLGPFPQTLNVGDTQQMNSENGHVGPFWMSPTQREATRHDIQLGTTSTNERNCFALELDHDAIVSVQVDQQTQQGYSKYGPVALTRLINEFKTHRCAFDFDYKFIWSVMNDD